MIYSLHVYIYICMYKLKYTYIHIHANASFTKHARFHHRPSPGGTNMAFL